MQGRPLDFCIAGAPKAGTTSLCGALDMVDGVHVLEPKDAHWLRFQAREPAFGGPWGEIRNQQVRDARPRYLGQLEQVPPQVLIGDATVMYMYDPVAVRNLAATLRDNGKVLICLRRPDDRAYSAWAHKRRDQEEPLDFAAALEAEDRRVSDGWMEIWWYRSLGFYADPLERLFDTFGRERVLVQLFEDITRAPADALRRTFAFLGVDAAHDVALPHRNASGVVRSQSVQRLITGNNVATRFARRVLPVSARRAIKDRVGQLNLSRATPMPEECRSLLLDTFAEDIRRVERLIDRDLSAWLQAPRR